VQEPFPASEVEIRNLGAEVQGEIVDTTGLPDSFVMKVHESDFSLACGKVADKHTPLVVQLGPDTDVFLKTHEEPRIEPELLVVGLRVHVKGLLGGTPEAPTLDADRVRVRAGRFDKGVVVEIDPATHSFRAEDGVLKDDFGGAVDSVRDVWVEILPETFFTKDASSEAGLYEAFETLEPDEYLEVRVFGLGDALEDFVRAYEIRAHVRHENGQDDDEGKDDEDDDDDDDEDDD
jgi:hypothetical protein